MRGSGKLCWSLSIKNSSYLRITRSHPRQEKYTIYYYYLKLTLLLSNLKQSSNVVQYLTHFLKKEKKEKVWAWKLISFCKKLLPYPSWYFVIFYPLACLLAMVPQIHSSLHLYMIILLSIWAFLVRNTRWYLRKPLFTRAFAYYSTMNS